jgi:hypothetical protein
MFGGTSHSSRRMKTIKTRRPTRPSFLEQAVGVCDRMATCKTKQKHVLLRVKDYANASQEARLDCFFLATEPPLLPGFWASPKNSSAFYENSLGFERASRSARPTL